MTYRTSCPHRSTYQSCLSKGNCPPIQLCILAKGLQKSKHVSGLIYVSTRQSIFSRDPSPNKSCILKFVDHYSEDHCDLTLRARDCSMPELFAAYLSSSGRPRKRRNRTLLHSLRCRDSHCLTLIHVISFIAADIKLSYQD